MKRLLLPVIILLIGCQTEEIETPKENPELYAQGQVTETKFGGMNLKTQKKNDTFIFEGDIIIPLGKNAKVYQEGEDVKSASIGSGFWKDNIVYYDIDPNLTNIYRVYDAVKHWESKTNLKFERRTDQQGYVYFQPGSGCSSYIGYTGFKQAINLSPACSTGNTIHEIGHAIGFWHEQSRADRDNYVKIYWENIMSGMEHNFYSYTENFLSAGGQDLTEALDFNSVMMYHPYSFSKNGLPTITKINGDLYSVNRNYLSEGDIYGANKIYPSSGEPEYINGKWYTLYGLTVLRFYDDWFYSGSYGMKAVYLKNGVWFYR